MTAGTNSDATAAGPPAPLYARALGPQFHRLAPALARLHGAGERRLRGTLRVRVGSRPWVRLLMRIARMPQANEAGAACAVTLIDLGDGERWQRRVGSRPMVSRQTPGGEREVVERIGPLAIRLRNRIANGGLWQRSVATTLFGLRLPALLGLQIVARERAIDADTLYCDMRLRSPLLGCLLQYCGTLRFVD